MKQAPIRAYLEGAIPITPWVCVRFGVRVRIRVSIRVRVRNGVRAGARARVGFRDRVSDRVGLVTSADATPRITRGERKFMPALRERKN
jgi:hypothetical protein